MLAFKTIFHGNPRNRASKRPKAFSGPWARQSSRYTGKLPVEPDTGIKACAFFEGATFLAVRDPQREQLSAPTLHTDIIVNTVNEPFYFSKLRGKAAR